MGSSPLTRGKPKAGVYQVEAWGLIPAHAGKTTSRCDSTGIAGAHPRSRGENRHAVRARGHPRGSSPLTRGKQQGRWFQVAGIGLIPAHAGKTGTSSSSTKSPRAHPRSRGENAAGQARRQPGKGSSPLTRGKRELLGRRGVVPGLIPAHAGKTGSPLLARPSGWAHPRSRGENAVAQVTGGSQPGSSPLTRGKPDQSLPRPHAPGLIPAHAGKTSVHAPTMRAHRAHPRSRGENRAVRALRGVDKGSSPLTRGKH